MPLFKDLHIVPVANLYYFCLVQFMYKHIYHTAPVTIISEVFNRHIHRYCTQGSQSVRVYYIEECKKLPIALSITHHITGILLLLSTLFQFSIGSINVIFSIMSWPKLLCLLQYQAYGGILLVYLCFIEYMTVPGRIIKH